MPDLRRIEPADIEALAELHAQCFPPEDVWSADQLRGSLDLSTTTGWVLAEQGTSVGFCLVQKVMDETEILTLCVAPAHRRRKLGQRLLQAVLDQQGAGTVFLEVAADNQAAVKLYESKGFELFSVRPDYYRRSEKTVDALNYRFMVKV